MREAEIISDWPDHSRTVWAAMMLTKNLDVCRSILVGDPVRVGQLEKPILRRALRGRLLPGDDEYIKVTAHMLAAVQEAGPL